MCDVGAWLTCLPDYLLPAVQIERSAQKHPLKCHENVTLQTRIHHLRSLLISSRVNVPAGTRHECRNSHCYNRNRRQQWQNGECIKCAYFMHNVKTNTTINFITFQRRYPLQRASPARKYLPNMCEFVPLYHTHAHSVLWLRNNNNEFLRESV